MSLEAKLRAISDHVALDGGKSRLTLQTRLRHVGVLCLCGRRGCRQVGCPDGPAVGTTDAVLFVLTCWKCSDGGSPAWWEFTEGDLAGDPLGLMLVNSPGSWQNIIDRLEATPVRARPTVWARLLSEDCS